MNVAVPSTCPTCHAAVSPESSFCTTCGAALPTVTVVRAVSADTGIGGAWGEAPRTRRTEAAVRAGSPRPNGAGLGPEFGVVVPAVTALRYGSYVIDALVVAVVGGAGLLLSRSALVGGLAAGELAIGLVVWEARSGRTIGNSLLGLRAAQVEAPWAPGLGRNLYRAAVLGAGHLVLGLGQLAMIATTATDPTGRRQGIHDRLARTVVIDVRGLRPAPVPSVPAAVAAPVVTPTMPVAAVAPMPAVAPVPVVAPVAVAAPVVLEKAAPVLAQPRPVVVDSPAPTVTWHTPTTYVMTLDTGQTVTVWGIGLVGRRPQVPTGEKCEHLVEIEDQDRSLSRTHARFGIDDHGFWVEDRGSANGTAVLGADGSWTSATAGERRTVPPGGTVRLGDRSFTVQPLV